MTVDDRRTTTVRLIALSAVALGLLAVSPAGAQLGTDFDLDIRQIDFGDAEEIGDRFGTALASGDFNGDGFADLAIGTSDEDIGALVDAGAVYVVYGSLFGFGLGPYQTFHQDSANMMDVAEAGDRFGSALATARPSGSDTDFLWVGAPGGDSTSLAVLLFPSIPDDGLSLSFSALSLTLFGEDSEAGAVLASGNFDGTGGDEVAVGVPGADLSATTSGMVYILQGFPTLIFADGFESGDTAAWGGP
jgi:hypothetical protein